MWSGRFNISGFVISSLRFMPSRCFQGSCWKTISAWGRTLRNIRDFLDLEVYYQTRSEDRVSFSLVYWLWHEESFSKGLLKHGRQLYIQHKSNELKFSNNCYIRQLEKNGAAASLYNTMPMRL